MLLIIITLYIRLFVDYKRAKNKVQEVEETDPESDAIQNPPNADGVLFDILFQQNTAGKQPASCEAKTPTEQSTPAEADKTEPSPETAGKKQTAKPAAKPKATKVAVSVKVTAE